MVKKKDSELKINFLFEILFVLVNVFIVALFYEDILTTTILLLIVAVIGLFKWKSKRTLILFILVGIVGALTEMYVISRGTWTYKITNFYNIPFWLFVLWGNAGALIYQLARKIKERRLEIK